MMHDDFDDLLRDAAQSYNVPPEPPREAMWETIARARDAARVVPIAPVRHTRRWLATAAGIAAVLMVGVVIGRASRSPVVSPVPVVASATAEPRVAPDTLLPSTRVAQDDVPGTADDAPRPVSGARRVASRSAAGRVAPRQRGDRENGELDVSGDASAYRLAVVEHLTRTELLLTSFRARERSGADVVADAQFAALSRELLGTTRLLLATRRNDDPVMTRLLQDLEYVLMQLAQYANDGKRADLDAINQSLDKRNVLPKLRSNIPAGVPASAGT